MMASDLGIYSSTSGPTEMNTTFALDLTVNAWISDDPPVINGFLRFEEYYEFDAPIDLAPYASITDVDTANYNGGKLTVEIIDSASEEDRLTIASGGSVQISGSNVSYDGTIIGTFAGGVGVTPLTVTFNENATGWTAGEVLRKLQYRNLADSPLTKPLPPRTVRATVTDGAGLTSNQPVGVVNVIPYNDSPVIDAFDTAVTYVANGVPVVLDIDATITDRDSRHFDGGYLSVWIPRGSAEDDRLTIRNTGLVATNGTNVTYGGTIIGTGFREGYGSVPLQLTFNENATPAKAQAVLRSVQFSNVSNRPSKTQRVIFAQVSDEHDDGSNLVSKLVNVMTGDNAPVVMLDGEVSYTENSAPILFSAGATITDVDSVNFDTGVLTIAATDGATADDRLTIRNQGKAAGKVGINAANVTYGGVVIGVWTGGLGTEPLAITFNANATVAIAQAVLRNVQYSNISDAPLANPRTVGVRLTDGDGGTSNLPTKLVKVVAVNDAPVIGAFDTTMAYVENAVPLVIDNNATVVDLDSANLAGGKLTVAVSANGQTTDRIGIKHVGNLAGQISVSGTTVRYGGVAIGTFAGTTSLVVTLNDKATPAAVQALLRSITFSSLSENPSVLDRTIKVTLTDGDGGTSNLPTKLVKVVAVNDAPVIGAFDTTVTYIAKGTPVVLDTNATVTDVDSVNLNSGVLTVGVITGGQVTDRIDIRHQGTGAGQIGVSGLKVTYGGTIIGSFSGTTSLKVIFNAAATPAAVQALLRNITFRSTSATPSNTNRTIKVTLTDGDGGTSNQPVKTVKVSAISPAASRSPRSSLSFNDLDLSFEMGLVESDLLTVG